MKDLYYILMYNQIGNVKQCKTLIKHGMITVNGIVETNVKYKVNFDDVIMYNHKQVKAQPFHYIMLNKPEGYLSANHDQHEPCVLDLIEEKDCFCLGRLDRDTTGLMLLTNDKSLKKLLLPESHVEKEYLVETKEKLKEEIINEFKNGVIIDENYQCLSAVCRIIDDYRCLLSIQEGRYHQIKKMMMSLHHHVIHLKRIRFDSIVLDESLKPGESRSLTQKEIESLLKA